MFSRCLWTLVVCFFGAIAFSGCILFEDPSEITGVDLVTPEDVTDISHDGEVEISPDVDPDLDPDHDAEDDLTCGPENPRACGVNCIDCTRLDQVADAACIEGACHIVACQEGFSNCDNQVANGCEITESDTSCGPSCVSCLERPNSLGGTCTSGVCVLTCEPAFTDCDGSLQNGCEREQDFQHCGAACMNCETLPNVKAASCAAAGCVIDACEWGFANCNQNVIDGCEQALAPSTCGDQCQFDCTALTGVDEALCLGDRCAILTCLPGHQDRNDDWTDGCEYTCTLGECWDEPLKAIRTTAFFGDGQRGIAGAEAHLIYLTNDGGLTWHPRRATPIDNEVRALAVADERFAMAVLLNGTVVRSLDAGFTWESVFLPTGMGQPLAVAIHGRRAVLVGSQAFATSNDYGATWTNRSTLLAGVDPRAIYLAGDFVMIGGANGEILRSDDAGQSLVRANSPTSAAIRFIVPRSQHLIIGGNGFVATTADRGATWTPVDGLPARAWTHLAAQGELMVVLSGNSFAYRRSATQTFTVVDVLEAQNLTGLLMVGEEARLFGYSLPFGHVFETERRLETPPEEEPVEIVTYKRYGFHFPEHDLRWLAGDNAAIYSGGGSAGQLFTSLDNGHTWSAVEHDIDTLPLRFPAITAGKGIIATASAYVLDVAATPVQSLDLCQLTQTCDVANLYVTAFQSAPDPYLAVGARLTDLTTDPAEVFPGLFIKNPTAAPAEAWFSVNLGPYYAGPPASNVSAISIQNPRIVVGTNYGEILVSTDLGASWESKLALNATAHAFTAIRQYGQTAAPSVVALTAGSAGQSSQIFFSESGGNGWPNITVPVTPAWRDEIAPTQLFDWDWHLSFGIAVGQNGTIIRTDNGGRTWTTMDCDTDADLRHVVVTANHIVAVSDSGVVCYSKDRVSFAKTAVQTLGWPVADVMSLGNEILLVAPVGQVRRSTQP